MTGRQGIAKSIERPKSNILITWGEIAGYMRVSVSTAFRFWRQDGLPVAVLPDGRRATSVGLIDAWLLARDPVNGDLPGPGGPGGPG